MNSKFIPGFTTVLLDTSIGKSQDVIIEGGGGTAVDGTYYTDTDGNSYLYVEGTGYIGEDGTIYTTLP